MENSQKDDLDESCSRNQDDEEFAKSVYDHVNGGQLDPIRVKQARKEEIEYFKKMKVYILE